MSTNSEPVDKSQQSAVKSPGGQGESPLDPTLTDPHHERENSRLLQMAIKKGWGLTPQKMEAISNRQAYLAIDPKSDPRVAVAAARVCVSMVGQAVDLIKPEIKNEVNITSSGQMGIVFVDDFFNRRARNEICGDSVEDNGEAAEAEGTPESDH